MTDLPKPVLEFPIDAVEGDRVVWMGSAYEMRADATWIRIDDAQSLLAALRSARNNREREIALENAVEWLLAKAANP